MALNATTLTNVLYAELESAFSTPVSTVAESRQALAGAIAQAVVAHLHDFAEVRVTIDANVNATEQLSLISGAVSTPVTGTASATQTLTVGIE